MLQSVVFVVSRIFHSIKRQLNNDTNTNDASNITKAADQVYMMLYLIWLCRI